MLFLERFAVLFSMQLKHERKSKKNSMLDHKTFSHFKGSPPIHKRQLKKIAI